ncbi:MAG: nucleotidyltransferase domain-containing protein [Candidatus Latescibacterota bacterium]
MVKTEDQLRDLPLTYIESLLKTTHIEKVVLYGSRADGQPHPESDLDLAVISPDFGEDRLADLQHLCHSIPRHYEIEIEALAYTPHEYEEATPLDFLGQIKRKGRVVYENGQFCL